jgi:L-threonylcarbamoyladenylate synthase
MQEPRPAPPILPWPDHPADQARVAAEVSAVLRRGGLVVYPTDTVYGLGADAARADAIERIYRVKGRPDEKAIIWLVDSVRDVRACCRMDGRVERLAERFWPGPLTLVLERVAPSPGGLATLGVRVPAHEAALAIIRALGGPVATTSANRSGGTSARTADEASGQLGTQVDLIIDAGASPVGQESTVLDLTTDLPRVLRPGALSADEIAAALGSEVDGGKR